MESEFGSVTNTASGVITGTSVYFYANYSTGGCPATTNAGTINITSKGGYVEFYNYGAGDIDVGGTVLATGARQLHRLLQRGAFDERHGHTTIDTPITVLDDKGGTGIYLSGDKSSSTHR